jgi:hypothetical protein
MEVISLSTSTFCVKDELELENGKVGFRILNYIPVIGYYMSK